MNFASAHSSCGKISRSVRSEPPFVALTCGGFPRDRRTHWPRILIAQRNLRRRLGERRSAQPPIVLLVVFALFDRYQLLPSLPATAVAVLLGTTGEPPVALRRRQRRAFDQSEDLGGVQKFNPVKQHGR
jgi:hypothetical protein